MRNIRKVLPPAAELLTALCAVIGTIGHYRVYGIGMLRFYTVDSNLFLMVTCLLSAFRRIRILRGRADGRSPGLAMLKYCSVCTVAVTFLVVVAVLTPMSVSPEAGFFPVLGWFLLGGERLWHHLICPVLALTGAALWDEAPGPFLRSARRALIPTLCYGVPVLVLNLLRCTEGPYEFFMVYRQGALKSVLLCLTVGLLAWLIALGVRALYGIRGIRASDHT